MLKKNALGNLTKETAITTLPKLKDMAFDKHFLSEINCYIEVGFMVNLSSAGEKDALKSR